MYNEGFITPEEIVYRYFVKYDKLNGLLNFAYNRLEVNRVNIYVDLYSMYHALYSRSYTTTVTNNISFTSTILNLCAHYRSFFKSLGIYSKIFLISSFNVPQNSILMVPEYNSIMIDKLKNKIIDEMVNLNTGLLEIICPYLPDIFYIKTDFESTIVMNEIMNREDMIESQDLYPIQSIIISSDFYPVQLVAQRNNVSFIRPLKTYKGDDSCIIPLNTHSQVKEAFWSGITQKYQNSSSYAKVVSISPSNFMLLESLNRFQDRCFPIIVNISRASKIISSCYGFDTIKLTPESLFDLLPEKEFKNIDKDLLVNRYRTLDLSYQNILYQQSLEPKTLHYENLEDPSAINIINDKYFANDPIDIFRL